MRLLLDTHALLWWTLNSRELSRRAYKAILGEESQVFVSAASAWEIATKARLGKLVGVEALLASFDAYLETQRFDPLPITVAHGRQAGTLPGAHRDPFDRMLAAQAHAEQLTLVSNDTVFDAFGVARLW